MPFSESPQGWTVTLFLVHFQVLSTEGFHFIVHTAGLWGEFTDHGASERARSPVCGRLTIDFIARTLAETQHNCPLAPICLGAQPWSAGSQVGLYSPDLSLAQLLKPSRTA